LLEDVFALQRRERAVPSAQAMDVLHGALDLIEKLLEGVAGNAPAVAPAEIALVRKELLGLARSPRPAASPVPPSAPRWSPAAPAAQDPPAAPTAEPVLKSTKPRATAKIAA